MKGNNTNDQLIAFTYLVGYCWDVPNQTHLSSFVYIVFISDSTYFVLLLTLLIKALYKIIVFLFKC